MLRDHSPIVIDKFNGLYARGDKDNTPLDHFQDCANLKFIGDSQIAVRDGLNIYQSVGTRLQNIARIYDYPTSLGNTLLVLCYDPNTGNGTVYHVTNATTIFGPILTIAGMKDMAFVPFDGRAYISPFAPSLPILDKPPAVAAVSANGVGLSDGTYQYGVTFTGAGGKETTPSDVTSILTSAGLPNPVNQCVITVLAPNPPGHQLTSGGLYTWKITYTTPSGAETLGNTASGVIAGPVNPAAFVGLEVNIVAPAGPTLFNVYRTTAGGATYFREQSNIPIASLFLSGSGNYWAVGTVSDAAIIANPTLPVANNTAQEQGSITQIPTGGTGVTGRKLYRTAVNATQLKLVHTFADNTTTIYTDAAADGTLGANAPTINNFSIGSTPISIGLPNEFLYVYAGDGTNARKAAGVALSGTPVISNGVAGHTDAGLHVFGWVSETVSGYLSAPSALGSFVSGAALSVSFTNVPVSTDANVVKRHLVASAVITGFNGNLEGYDLFFVPNATIQNNSDTALPNISFYDADLLDDASHLFDNYSSIPAGAVLSIYNDHLCLFAIATDISIGLISAANEPEAISQVSGILIVPPDGNPVSNAQELRDVLYVTKGTKTTSFIDNGGDPSTWSGPLLIDNGLGSFNHGIATVLDSGSASVDFLLVATYQGISLFNGRYITPELTWKIQDFWRLLDRTLFNTLQLINAPIQKELYVILPDFSVLVGNYANGMDPQNIRWSIWTFAQGVNTIAVVDINNILLGSAINAGKTSGSGIYEIDATKTHDILYSGGGTVATAIPDPFFKLGFIGG